MNFLSTLWAVHALKRTALALFIVTAITYQARANTITITTTTAKWSTTTGGSGTGGAIGAADDIIIQSGATGATFTVDQANATCNSITFNNASASTGTLSVNSGITLTVVNIILQNGLSTNTVASITGLGAINVTSLNVGGAVAPSGNSTSTLTSAIASLNIAGNIVITAQSGGGSKKNSPTFNVSSGSISVNGTITATPAANGASAAFALTATSPQTVLLSVKNATPFLGTGTFTLNSSGATVDYSGAGNQTVSTAVTYNNLTFSNTGTKTTASGTLTIAGTWDVSSPAALNTNNTAVNVTGDITGSGALTQGTGVINVGGNWSRSSVANFNPSSAGVTLTGTNKIIAGSSGLVFSTLTVNGTYTNNQTGTNALTVSTALTGTGTLTQAPNANLNIGGTSSVVTLAATATGNTVSYTGTGAQTIQAVPYYNLGIAGGGSKTLAPGITEVQNSATFTSGIVTSTTSNLLVFDNNATATGASSTSFVNGPVKKIGNNAFIFPVGKGGKYVPLGISALSSATDAYTAEYVESSGAVLGPITAADLQAVSNCQYWRLDASGASPADITLYYDVNNSCPDPGFTYSPSLLKVAHFDETGSPASWDTYGGAATAGSTTTSGSVTWNNVTVFGPFTLGTQAAQSTLPVTFAYFTGKKAEGGNQLTWKVAGENNVKQYDIERSIANNNGFVKVASIPATGSDNYSFMDVTSLSGTVYYRIKNVDYDGRFKYSTVLSLKNGAGSVVFKAVPTVVVSSVTVQHNATNGAASISISTIDGRVLRNIRPAAGSMQTAVDMSNLQRGLYLLKWSDGSGGVEVAKIIKQ